MTSLDKNKPCLVETSQGFSVKYNERFLYSKYNPEKNILQIVENISILPGTLILCFSPLLGYGINNLIQKLPNDCILLGCEVDEELFSITKEFCSKLEKSSSNRFYLLSPSEVKKLPILLETEAKNYLQKRNIKRIIKIDFSAGTTLYPEFYSNLEITLQSIINQFWKNRITLVNFGRRYSRNLIKNLSSLKNSVPLTSLFKTVSKNILVLGTGESLEKTIEQIKNTYDLYFIIAVDASLPILKKYKIKADIVVCEESQIAIAKAFIGCKKYAEYSVAGLTSCHNTVCTSAKNNSWFIPIYENTNFLKRLQNLKLVPFIPPLGSVGLTATYLALNLRKDENIKIFVSGLDFSFSAGKTHANGAPANIALQSYSNRLFPAANYNATYNIGTSKFLDKSAQQKYTNVALNGYANIFNDFFANEINLFDATTSGIKLNIPYLLPQPSNNQLTRKITANEYYSDSQIEKVINFLNNELEKLNELKDILTSKIILSETERNKKILEIISEREYLFLHFPDGTHPSLKIDFLKRIRTEIVFFEKDINSALKNLR
ncbi:MAG: DUF115 domain-containing protein [Treponema sp.]|nr:DUF115 domain-containing protein [Treponema sp.]